MGFDANEVPRAMTGRTLFDKVWDDHVVAAFAGDWALVYIDRNLVHDLSGTVGLREMKKRTLPIANPELAFSTPDHAVSSAVGRDGSTFAGGARLYGDLKHLSEDAAIRFFDLGRPGHGIVHVMGPELGIVQPGTFVICGDSHTCTNGAFGAVAFGVGASELTHSLATQTLLQRKPKTMRIHYEGRLSPDCTAKDLILHTIARLGADAGSGHAVEYTGAAIDAMTMEERMTLCNLSIEMGAKIGMIAPDATTLDYLRGRPYSPSGSAWDAAVDHWRTLRSDDDAHHDKQCVIAADEARPMITWGTSPEHAVPLDGRVPDPARCADADRARNWTAAQDYMGLDAGMPMLGLAIDRVFIGSCTNARLDDLRAAAAVIDGGRVAAGVVAWVVPGSEDVKRAAEAEGLARRFLDAGFEWREPGCSMCGASNGERGEPGERVLSTTNRNFIGRQGPGVRTHLVSPATAAASALAGVVSQAGAA
jgi:3-isopropylmalate/(R)-2-methylmalate dehydratase large subunit